MLVAAAGRCCCCCSSLPPTTLLQRGASRAPRSVLNPLPFHLFPCRRLLTGGRAGSSRPGTAEAGWARPLISSMAVAALAGAWWLERQQQSESLSHWSFSSQASRSSALDLATKSSVPLTEAGSNVVIPSGVLELTLQIARELQPGAATDCHAVIHFPGASRRTPFKALKTTDDPTTAGSCVVFGEAARFVVTEGSAQHVIRIEMFAAGKKKAGVLLGATEVSLAKLASCLTDLELGGELTLDLQDKARYGQGLLQCTVRMVPPPAIKSAFWRSFSAVIDQNGDGLISVPELRNFLLFLHNEIGSVASTTTLARVFGNSVADDHKTQVPLDTVIDALTRSPAPLLHLQECPMTGKPFSAAMQADEYAMMCNLLQRMVAAEHGDFTVPAPIDERHWLGRGWLSCISEWKAMNDSGGWQAGYSHSGGSRRRVRDRRTGQVETELVPGKVTLALNALYSESLFAASATARVSKALTMKQGRKCV